MSGTVVLSFPSVKLNGKRTVAGILRGFDPFMNLVVDEAVEIRKDKTSKFLGIVVSFMLLNISPPCTFNVLFC